MMLRRSVAPHVFIVVGLLAWPSRYVSPQEIPDPQNGQSQTATTILSACERLSGLELGDTAITEAVALPTIERQVYGPEPQVVNIPMPHCRIAGTIDLTINFELLLPDVWNGKFIMGGGGGFVGSVDNQAQGGMSVGLTPLERGYATVGTDTGHSGSPIDANWALNDQEAKDNFAGRAVHRTVEVSKTIITDYYGGDIDYSYFLGCSRGGGQAMISAQRYPQDFDGVIAGAPALDWPGVTAAFVYNQQLVFPNPNQVESPVITEANRKLLAQSLRNSCDAIDGVADGILNDPRMCAFDPVELPRCQSGPGDGCVTDTQLTAIQAIYAGPNVAGDQLHPGFPFGGEMDPWGWAFWITRAQPSTLPPGLPNLQYAYGTEFFKYFIVDNPDWSYAGYGFQDWHKNSAEAAALLNATDPDLSEYRDAGGKIIMWHGWSDAGLSALDSIEYYDSVEQQNPALRGYFRLFLMPGVSHCEGGPGPDRADWISAIELWVEDGIAPEYLIASKSDDEDNVIMERPLCPYPQIGQYDGSGDPNLHGNYDCIAPEE